MIDEANKAKQRQREIEVVKKIVEPDQQGRGAYLLGLFACRLATGYSQSDLAERAQVARGTVRSLERGERRAHAATTRRLSEALAVSPADLLTAEAIEKE